MRLHGGRVQGLPSPAGSQGFVGRVSKALLHLLHSLGFVGEALLVRLLGGCFVGDVSKVLLRLQPRVQGFSAPVVITKTTGSDVTKAVYTCGCVKTSIDSVIIVRLAVLSLGPSVGRYHHQDP